MRYTLHLVIALCTIVVLLAIPSSVMATGYLFHIVDYPGTGIEGTFLTGINNTGQVVGGYNDHSGSHGFVYSGGMFSPSPQPQTVYFAINDSGLIVGKSEDERGGHGLVRSGSAVSPPIDFPKALFTEFLGLNNAGQTVGEYWTSETSAPHALRYSGGAGSPLDIPGTAFSPPLNIPGAVGSFAKGINDSGIIVGDVQDAAGSYHGFVLSGGSVTPIDVPFSMRTEAWGINNTGQVVGCYSWTGDPTRLIAFVRDNGSFSTFSIPAADDTCALKVNDAGQIVGYYRDEKGIHGFIATPIPDIHLTQVSFCARYPRVCRGIDHPWVRIKPEGSPPRYFSIGPLKEQERIDCQAHKGLCQELIAVMRTATVRPGATPSTFILTTSPVDKPAPAQRPSTK